MNEEVTHEIRIIETEDGFRIELKGDKEELRRLIFDRGGFAWGKRFRRHVRGHWGRHERHHHEDRQPRKRHGRRPHGRGRYDLGPWWDTDAPIDDAV